MNGNLMKQAVSTMETQLKLGQVGEALNRLDDAIAHANSATDKLHDKISTVLEPWPLPGEAGCSTPSSCELAARLNLMAQRLEDVVAHLNNLHNSVAL